MRKLVHAAAAQSGGILPHGDGVLVHDAEQAVVLVLQSHPIPDGAHVGSQRQLTGGLYAAEDPFPSLLHIVHAPLRGYE